MRTLLLALLLLLAALPARAQSPVPPPEPAEHLVLVDVSGSMEKGGFGTGPAFSADFQGWVRSLFQPGAPGFRDGDTVTFRPFSDEETERKEDRQAVGPVPLADAASTFASLKGPGGGATDLERVLTRLVGPRSPDARVRYVWIFTDNQNNLGTKKSDAEFYRLLRDQPDFDSVYFIPMALPTSGSGALVLYLLVDAEEPVTPWIDGFVDEVEKRLGFEAVLFRPLYNDLARPVLQFGDVVQSANEKGAFSNAIASGNRIIVNLYRKGNALEGRLRFQLRSRMDGWEITDAALTADLQADGLEGDLTPKVLSVQPNRETEQQYVLVIRHRDPKAKEVQADLLLQAEVRLSATGPSPNLKPFVSPTVQKLMDAVPQLNEILSLMQEQRDSSSDGSQQVRHISLHQPLLLRPPTAAPGGGSHLLPLLLVPGLLLVALLAWALSGRTYLLDDRRIRLGGFFGRAALESRDGDLLGHLQAAGREVRIVPEPDVTVDGHEGERDVNPDHGEVSFKLQGKRGATVFHLARPGAGGGASGPDDGLSL